MTLNELLTQIREFYLRHFRAVIKEQRQDPSVQLLTEVVLRTADGAIVHEGPLELPMRADVAVLRDDKVCESFQITAQHSLAFKPFTFRWTSGAAVTVGPFQWEQCEITLRGIGAENNWKPLADWFGAWFDVNDERGMFVSDLQGVVHSLAGPEFRAAVAHFTLDLGSAPAEVFEYLLDALEQTGGKAVEIGQVGSQKQPAQDQ